MKKKKKVLMRKEQRRASEERKLAKIEQLQRDLEVIDEDDERAEEQIAIDNDILPDGTTEEEITENDEPGEEEDEVIESTVEEESETVDETVPAEEKKERTDITGMIPDDQPDLELLSLESLNAHAHRNLSVLDMLKEVLSYSARQNKPDSEFALVVKRGGKKERKYPIHDVAHVRNALARAAQQIKEGGEGAADARRALPKIRSAAKKFGIVVSTKKEHNAIMIEKDANGKWRWVGWVSNNFIDWDGDIISEDAHKEYLGWLDDNMDVAPVFVSWHTPGTARKAQVDFASYENGFLIMSGPLEDTEAAGLMKASKIAALGMSHGSFVLGRDPSDPRVITKYRMYEVSDLPLENAANPFTDFQTMVKEVDMVDKKKYLAELLGSEELAQKFLDKAGLKQADLREADIPEKEKKDEVPAEAPPSDLPVPAADPVPDAPVAVNTAALVEPVVVAAQPPMDEILARVMKELDAEGLNAFVTQAQEAMAKVPILETLIKDMQTTSDEKLAEKLTPPAARFAWSQENRPSQAKENVLDKNTKKDNDLVKGAPGVPEGYWLSKITGTTPVTESE